ncbi:DUF305 domain-containing protein [Altericista sp. CCNU0014]|uniref:DUF305 domain-containing protein n=1 Tax=Altericista sp. CCNU0014 TaxID=3082949 RepID=UPI00384B9248
MINHFKKAGLLLGLAVTVPLSSLFVSCNVDFKTQAQAPSPTRVDSGAMKGQGNRGGMGHNMSMDLGPADENLDLRFIDAMIPHHEGAVVMAKEAQQKAKRPQLQKLAKDIIQAQNREIAQMKQWRKAWYPKESSTPMAWSAEMGHMMAMSPSQKQSMMMSQDLGAADAGFDLRFINAMIPHHEGAIAMAKEVLGKSKRPDIQKLAQNIIASQQTEIKQMRDWKQAWAQK